jgi:hypothetical protein
LENERSHRKSEPTAYSIFEERLIYRLLMSIGEIAVEVNIPFLSDLFF